MPLSSLAWRAAAGLAEPGLRFMLRRRTQRGKEVLARLPERRGVEATLRPSGTLLWLHAASVGEAESILSVLAALARESPETHVLLTTGTVTSATMLGRRLPALGLDRVQHRFAPLDVPRWASRFLDHWRPDAAAFVESELWPNLVAACRARSIPLMLVNGRMSERSAQAWRRMPALARAVLGSFATVQAGSEADAERLRALGAGVVQVPGNLKLAAAPLTVNENELARLHAALTGRPRWLAASTHPGEEALIAEVHARLAPRVPGLLTVIAPRHPERGAAIAAALGGVPRRAIGQGPPPGGVWLADTLGELGLLYRLCGVTVVGRSLVPPGGGQNPLEPARLGCAVAVGQHTANFADAVQRLQGAGGLTVVDGTAALAAWAERMLLDGDARSHAGNAACRAATGDSDLPRRVALTLLALAERG
jgi:3-deoxy-D-manno-octulosonic-acid transferase